MTSGRSATSFSASPGSAKSDETVRTLNGAFAGACGSTTSCSGALGISRPPSPPALARPAPAALPQPFRELAPDHAGGAEDEDVHVGPRRVIPGARSATRDLL